MHCNNGLNNKLVESLVENKVAQESGDLKYLQDSMYDFVSTLKEIILGEYSPEFFNKYVDEALKLHGSNLEEFLKIPKMGLELRQALESIDDAIDTSNQEFKDNLVLLLDRFQTTIDNIVFEARDPYDIAVELGFHGTKEEWLEHLEGDSAYKIATLNGFLGNEQEWLADLEGDSAYEIAIKNGYVGSEGDWLKYLVGDSAYKIAVDNGFVGSKQDWLTSLKPTEGTLQALTQFMNNDSETDVTVPELGNIPSLQGHIKQMFENGGLPATPFETKALMEASALVDGDYALVTDDGDSNGLYYKKSGLWELSEYNPLSIFNTNFGSIYSQSSKQVFRATHIDFKNEGVLSITGSVNTSTNYMWWHTDKIPVKKGQFIFLRGYQDLGHINSIIYYDTDGLPLNKGSMSSDKLTGFHEDYFIVEQDGFIQAQHHAPEDVIGCELIVFEGAPEYFANSLIGQQIFNAGFSKMLGFYEGNLINYSDIDTKHYINNAVGSTGKNRGSKLSNENFPLVYSTGFIKVSPNTSYYVSNNAVSSLGAGYDSNFTAVQGFVGRTASNVITTGENVEYVRLSINTEEIPLFESYMVEGTEPIEERNLDGVFVKLVKEVLDNTEISIDNLSGFTKGTNLLNPKDVHPDKYVNHATGRLQSNAKYPYAKASGFIAVNPGSTYTISNNDIASIMAEYDENKVFIKGHAGRIRKTYIVSDTTYFIQVNLHTDQVPIDEYVIVEGTDIDAVKPDYVNWIVDLIQYEIRKAGGIGDGSDGGSTPVPANSRFLGKKLLVTGDSITQESSHTDRPWHRVVHETLGLLQVQNDAKSGAGLVKNGGTNYRLPNWETRFDTPDFVLNMANMNDGTTIAPTNDWNWIYGGEGDPHKGDWDTVITAENMADSLWYAVRYCCEQILELYPNVPFGWITSQPRAMVATKSGTPREGYSNKCWGRDGWFSEWVDVIKEICGHYSIPVLDLYHESSLRPWLPENNSYYFSREDKIHPNTLGHQVLANRIIPFIEQYM